MLVALTTPALASAEVRLSVVPPDAECVPLRKFERRLDAWLSERALSDRPRDVTLLIRQTATRGWIADIQVRATETTLKRSISTRVDDCRDLDEALVLVTGVLLESASEVAEERHSRVAPIIVTLEETPRAAIASDPEPAPATWDLPSPERPSSSPRALDEPPRGSSTSLPPSLMDAGGSFLLGALGGPVVVVAVGARLPVARRWAFRLGISGTPFPTKHPIEDSGRVELSLATANVAACLALHDSATGLLDICAGAVAGMLVADTEGITGGAPVARPVLWPAAGFHAGHRVGSLILGARVGGGVGLVRDEFVVSNRQAREVALRPVDVVSFESGVSLGMHVP